MKLSFFKRKTREQQFETTLEKYQRAAAEAPDDIRLRVKMAELCLEYNKRDKAIEEYITAARAYQAKRLSQIAVAIYNHILAIDPGQVEIYKELADLHVKNGFVGDGVAVLEKLAQYYYDRDMKFEATQTLTRISELDPDNEYFKFKVSRFCEGKDLKGKEILQDGPKNKWELVDERGSERPVAQSDIGDFFDLEAALKDDDSISLSTGGGEIGDGPDAVGQAGFSHAGIFNELKSTIDAHPDQDSPEFHFGLGEAYQRCNQTEEALAEFSRALEGLSDKAQCYINLAECCTALRRLDEAERFVDQGLTLPDLTDQQRLSLYYQQGLVYKARGDRKKALKVFEKIYDQDCTFKSVRQEIKKISKY